MPNTDIPFVSHDNLLYYHQHVKANEFATKQELLGKADSATTYTKTQVDTALGDKADVSTTYTKTEVDTALGGKADAATTYTKSQVDDLIAGITGVSFSVVQALPATGEAGVIYLVSHNGSSSDVYDEYIYVNNGFEKIGTTDVDLSGYVQTSDLTPLTEAQIDTIIASSLPTS